MFLEKLLSGSSKRKVASKRVEEMRGSRKKIKYIRHSGGNQSIRKGSKVKTTTTKIVTQHDIYNGDAKGWNKSSHTPACQLILSNIPYIVFFLAILHTTINCTITNSSGNEVEYKPFKMSSDSSVRQPVILRYTKWFMKEALGLKKLLWGTWVKQNVSVYQSIRNDSWRCCLCVCVHVCARVFSAAY